MQWRGAVPSRCLLLAFLRCRGNCRHLATSRLIAASRRNGIRADATSAELSFARGTCAPRPRRRVDVCNVGTARSAARAGRAQGEAVLQLPATQVPLQIEQVKPLPAAAVEVELVAEDEEWSFACGAVRRRFVQRVFCVLACMAVAVAVCACVGVRVGAVRRWVQGHVAAYALAYVAVVAVYVPLALAPKARRRQPPLNYLWLVVLSACTRWDVAGHGLYLCVATAVFLAAASVIVLFCSFSQCIAYERVLNLWLSSAVALAMAVFLLCDAHTLMSGRRVALRPSEVVAGALWLWADVANLYVVFLEVAALSDD